MISRGGFDLLAAIIICEVRLQTLVIDAT